MQNEILQLELIPAEEQIHLQNVYCEEQRKNKTLFLKELRKDLELVYFREPKTNNDIMLNLQHDYLLKGSEAARTKLWVMAYSMCRSILRGELKRRKRYMTQDEQDDNISKAVFDVMKRYDKVYYRGTKEQREAKLYPFAYSVKNYVIQFQLAVKKTLGFIPYVETQYETLENIPAIQEEENEEEIMKEAIKKYFDEAIKTDTALAEVYEVKKLDGCIKYIVSQAKKHLNSKSGAIEDVVVFKWARDYMYGDTADQTEKEAEEEPNLEEECEQYKTEEPKAEKKQKKQNAIDDGQQLLFDF